MPGCRTREAIEHVVKHPSNRITVLNPSTVRVLRGVPMKFTVDG